MSLDDEGRAEITFRKLLVFLEQPAPGDLQDAYELGTNKTTSAVIYSSPDAREIAREERTPGRQTVSWLPREPIVLNALYEHQHGWRPSSSFADPAVCIEYECSMRTGVFTIELSSSSPFDAAVLFERPRWPLRLTERAVIRTALQQLQTPGRTATVAENGTSVIGELKEPRVGTRYFLVAFRRCGIADCEAWLMRTSLFHRVQQTVSTWAQGLAG